MTVDAISNDTLDALETALTRTTDAKAGFEKMVEKAEPEFKSYVQEFLVLHNTQAAELSRILADNGRTPDSDGSFMSSVNTAVVSLRSMFDEIDDDVMDNVRDGEQHVLNAYNKVLEQGPSPAAEQVAKMKSDLETLLASTAHLDRE